MFRDVDQREPGVERGPKGDEIGRLDGQYEALTVESCPHSTSRIVDVTDLGLERTCYQTRAGV